MLQLRHSHPILYLSFTASNCKCCYRQAHWHATCNYQDQIEGHGLTSLSDGESRVVVVLTVKRKHSQLSFSRKHIQLPINCDPRTNMIYTGKVMKCK